MRREIGIVGFGNQATAWASNLKESGFEVQLFLRPTSQHWSEVEKQGFKVEKLGATLAKPSYLALLIPDEAMPSFFQEYGQRLRKGQSLIFAHGFSLHY